MVGYVGPVVLCNFQALELLVSTKSSWFYMFHQMNLAKMGEHILNLSPTAGEKENNVSRVLLQI